jgi:uncharacterized protein
MPKRMAGKRNRTRLTLIGLAGLILLLSAGAMVLAKVTYDEQFARVEAPPYSAYLTYGDVTGYARQAVKFASGANMLAGYIYGAEHNQGLVVISHGLGYDAEHYLPVSLYFVDHGWRVFSFDNTGTHESGGSSSLGLPQSAEDLEAALTYIESDADLRDLPVMLFGHSWGGYAVTAILNYNHPVSASVSLAGFNAPGGLLLEGARDELGAAAYLEYPFLWAYQAVRFGSAARLTAVAGLNRGTTPVMIIHGSADEEIRYDGASIIARRAAITNPNVVYETRSTAGHNGHNNLYMSEAAVRYAHAKNEEYRSLYDQYDGNVPEAVKAAYYATIDKLQTSELDAAFMDTINRFYEAQLGQ